MKFPTKQSVKGLVSGAVIIGIGLTWAGVATNDHNGCGNITCLLQQDAELSQQFNPDVPMFVDASNSRPLLEANPEFKHNPQISHMLDVLTENTRHMRQSTPPSPSCAIVGNSQNLLRSDYGTLIDSHVFVFRMNSAPIDSYAQDVGTRTTHHIFSHFYSGNYKVNDEIRIRPYETDTFNILIPLHSNPNIPFSATYKQKDYASFGKFYANLAEALSSDTNAALPPLTRDNMTQVRDVPNLVVFTPDFLWYANEVWFNPQKKEERDIASTGFMTIILALNLCEQIDLFGFGPTQDGSWGKYFSDYTDKPTRHQPSYQEQFLENMEAKRIIKVYRGKQ